MSVLSKLDAGDLLRRSLADFASHPALCAFVAASFVGVLRVAKATPSGGTNAALQAVNARPTAAAQAAKKRRGPAVDGLFVKRLRQILNIAIPSWHSYEALLLLTQASVLVARSMLSVRMAQLSGDGLKEVMQGRWRGYALVLLNFAITGLMGSVVNSALKYLTNLLTVRLRTNLTNHVHDSYLANRNYYKAAILQQGHLDNADQRIVEDLHQFCVTASDLYSRTFKPAIDVVLSTARMSQSMGLSGLLVLYSYFFISSAVVRSVSPPFPKLIAHQQSLEGNFRRAHARLITNAEEIAFLNGSAREQVILNGHLSDISVFSLRYFYLQFKQGIVDQWMLKYGASMVGWPVLAVPFLMHKGSVAEIAARYRESDALIQQASSSIGDLMMVYKKLQRLAGFTARVMELLESVDVAEAKAPSHISYVATQRIEFDHVTICAPDGRLLVKELSVVIEPGCNVFVSGANGAGKSSMFRVLASLWTPASGRVLLPNLGDPFTMFYVPQKPYLVSGSLRDQVTYPLKSFDESIDERVKECLSLVNLLKLVDDKHGLGLVHHDWADVLSGGEKQRIGLARLYFHRPRFAILDEATSAINANEEEPLYSVLKQLGITVFSISHRPSLLKFHHKHLHFVGDGSGAWTLEDVAHTP